MSSYKGKRTNQIRNTLSDFYGQKARPVKDRFYEKMMTTLRHNKKDFLVNIEQVNTLAKNTLTDEMISVKRVEGLFMVWLATAKEKQDYFKEWKKSQDLNKPESTLYLLFIKEVNLIWH